MEKAAFLHIGLLLCLVLGMNFMVEARSLTPKYTTKIEIHEEVEPTFIFIENNQHDKTHKLEKHIAKIEKKLKKLDTSYKRQLKDMEILANMYEYLVAKSISNTYITNDETQSFADNLQMKIQEIERIIEYGKKRDSQHEESEKTMSVEREKTMSSENIPDEVESSLGMFDSEEDDAAGLRVWKNIMLLPFQFNTEGNSKSLDSEDMDDMENEHQYAMPEFKPEIDDDEMPKNSYNWIFSSEEEK